VGEHRLELGRHDERDHPGRAVVERPEALGPFRVEGELDNRDDDERDARLLCPAMARSRVRFAGSLSS
jgi:hypothetical protein